MKKIFRCLLLMFLCLLGTTSCDLSSLLNGSSGDQEEQKQEEHTHNYASYGSDSAGHWKVCSCGKKETEEAEAHTYSDTITKEATTTETGIKTYTCSVCGYSYTETIDKVHVHNHKTLKTNRTGVHYWICECGEEVDEAPHDFEESIYTAAQIGTPGKIKRVCKVCAYSTYKTYEVSQDVYNAEADALIPLITALNNTSTVDEVVALLTRYNLLNDTAKARVTNSSVLLSKKTELDSYWQAQADPIIALINQLPEVASITNQITDIGNAIEAKDETVLDYITNYDIYLAAKDIYDQFKDLGDLSSADVKRTALVNTAIQFYEQHLQIEYEQRISRRNVAINPEFANSYEITYQDCSSFCNSVYHYVTGQSATSYSDISTTTANLMSYAKTNSGSSTIIPCYYDDLTIGSKTLDKANEIKAKLQVGDLYVYRHGTGSSAGGHVMLYIGEYNGVASFAHCTGDSGTTTWAKDALNATDEKNTSEKKRNGAILIESIDCVFTQSGDRWIFDSDNNYWCIIRPINRSATKTSNITIEGISKVLYPYVSCERTVDIGNYHSAVKGTNLVYTITIDNTSTTTDQKYIYVKETIPENATYVSCTEDGIYDEVNKTIIWRLPLLEKNKSIELTYTLQASGDIGDLIDDDNTTVNGVKLGRLMNTIKANITEQQIISALDSFNFYSNNVDASSNSMVSLTMVKLINSITGKDISSDLPLSANYFDDIYSDYKILTKDTDSYDHTIDTTATILKVVPEGLMGGKDYRAEMSVISVYNTPIRNLQVRDLEVGDILVVKEFSVTNSVDYYAAYIYVSPSTLYSLTGANENVCFAINAFQKTYSTNKITNVTKFMHTVTYHDEFMVIRPTIASSLNSLD